RRRLPVERSRDGRWDAAGLAGGEGGSDGGAAGGSSCQESGVRSQEQGGLALLASMTAATVGAWGRTRPLRALAVPLRALRVSPLGGRLDPRPPSGSRRQQPLGGRGGQRAALLPHPVAMQHLPRLVRRGQR